MDRNLTGTTDSGTLGTVALRKESVDRNHLIALPTQTRCKSLSARRAWIEMHISCSGSKTPMSLSARRAWIEIFCNQCNVCQIWSLSARRAWIEIITRFKRERKGMSLSARRAWIEIGVVICTRICRLVALRKESVDRNRGCLLRSALDAVALRKESVDRNWRFAVTVFFRTQSLSARRAWIEMVKYLGDIDWTKVALRKESVDRNQ